MDEPLLIKYPKRWLLHWWGAIRQGWWKVVVLALFVLLPFLGFLRDEFSSPSTSKALHVVEIISNTPTSWLIIIFMGVLLVMTVEGTFRKALDEAAHVRAQTSSLNDEIIDLQRSLEAARRALTEPKLAIEILDYDASEIVGEEPSPISQYISMGMGLGQETNNQVSISASLRIKNEHRVETAIQPGSFRLHLFEISPESDRSFEPESVDAALFGAIRYALPVEGKVRFALKKSTALTWIRYWMFVSVIDGNGSSADSPRRYLGFVKPPTSLTS